MGVSYYQWTGGSESIAMKDDLRTLLKNPTPDETHESERYLKVLIVDDEPTVHDITALVLKNFQYRGFQLQLRSAFSASEARRILASEGPFALILLDVIMETDDSGLRLAQFIREELRDPMVRIILRTGQPGMVPQRQVMRDFEIDDYKEKAELTSERFDAAVTASIRTYLGFRRLEDNRQGLIRILKAIRSVEPNEKQEEFARHILAQIEAVMNRIHDAEIAALVVQRNLEGEIRIITAQGPIHHLSGILLDDIEDQQAASIIRESMSTGTVYHDQLRITAPLMAKSGECYLAYFEDPKGFGDMERYLVELYTSHVNVSMDNKMLTRELVDTQREIISTLGEVIETRSGETGRHVQRVGEIARLIATEVGMSSREREQLRFAAPLHDIGKVGIPDAVLNKPGPLTSQEYELIKSHTTIGYTILKSSKREVLRMGARICHEHHERWDGSGYPQGIAGESISLEARICSIADVLDALCSKRVYKDAMPLEEAFDVIFQGRDTQFDPLLVDALLRNKDDVRHIYSEYSDQLESA
ncbi:MAG: DUF3369 domain-containing protein [Spirochaetales bacterium]|nr:DUF3369 domain-containing protein [Spirochaetales bacterium]